MMMVVVVWVGVHRQLVLVSGAADGCVMLVLLLLLLLLKIVLLCMWMRERLRM